MIYFFGDADTFFMFMFMFMFIGVTVAMLFVTMEGLIDTGELKK